MSLTTQQPKGQCVWGARAIILVTGKHFAEKWARRIVLPNCWDFFAELGGWLNPPPHAVEAHPPVYHCSQISGLAWPPRCHCVDEGARSVPSLSVCVAFCRRWCPPHPPPRVDHWAHHRICGPPDALWLPVFVLVVQIPSPNEATAGALMPPCRSLGSFRCAGSCCTTNLSHGACPLLVDAACGRIFQAVGFQVVTDLPFHLHQRLEGMQCRTRGVATTGGEDLREVTP